jgi:integrase
MAWAERLPNGYWRACWRDTLGKARSTTRDPNTNAQLKEAQAKRLAGDMETAARRGEKTGLGASPTWGNWCPMWLESRVVEPSTAEVDLLRIDRYLMPQWGPRRLNRITRSEVQAWVMQLSRGHLAPGSVEKVVRLFSASMTAAVRDERVPVIANPCSGVDLPRVAPGHERFLTRGEVEAIAHQLGEPYRLAVLLAAGTGLRWGELAGLHWQRVDLGECMIDVVETWDPTAGG